VEYRELTFEEKLQVPNLPTPEMLVVGAVNDEGQVEAACGVMQVLHLDPLWVNPEKRGLFGFRLIRLWDAVKARLVKMGAKACTASVMDGYPGPPYDRVVEHLSTKLAGGEEVDARIWLIPLEDAHSDTLGATDGDQTSNAAGAHVSSASDHQP
jgi:hypothetical protein